MSPRLTISSRPSRDASRVKTQPSKALEEDDDLALTSAGMHKDKQQSGGSALSG